MLSLRGITAAAVAAVSVLGVVTVGPASAATGFYFNANSGVSRIDGILYWTSGDSFKLVDVDLYDTSCDSRSAQFFVEVPPTGSRSGKTDGKGCNTSVHYNELDYDISATVNSLQVFTYACNTWGCSSQGGSQVFDNPYV